MARRSVYRGHNFNSLPATLFAHLDMGLIPFSLAFPGESMDPDAMIVIAIEKEVDIGGEKQERPVMMFFKHGLEEEKF